MKYAYRFFIAILLCSTALAADPPWQKMTNPSAAEVAAKFKNPPAEYANTVTWGWGGPVSEESIARDIQNLHDRGFRIATIEAGSNMTEPYLSDPATLAEIVRHIPLGRVSDPDEIGSTICFLASEEASYITGSAVVVDGGRSA